LLLHFSLTNQLNHSSSLQNVLLYQFQQQSLIVFLREGNMKTQQGIPLILFFFFQKKGRLFNEL